MATLTSYGDQVAKHLDQAQLDQLSQIHDNEEYLESDDPLFETLLDILIGEVSPEDWNHNTAGIRDDPSEYIDYVMDNMFKGDEPKWWEGGESAQLNHLISIIDEDNLGNVAKKQRAEKLDVAKIRDNLRPTKTIVTKKSEDPTEVDTTTVTINDPETDTKAVEKISADPRIATTTTITTKEVGGDFDDELGHVLADVDTGTIVPESETNEAYKKGRPRRKGNWPRRIQEDLKPMDLESLIHGTISVDKHKSKLGEDKDVIVLAMEVKNNDAANDLMTFIERGYTDVIDADSISSENIDGDYVVFVEFERKDTFKTVLSEMLDGVEKLTGINDWSFNHYKSSKILTMEELHERLPITPEDYDSFLAKEQNIKDQLQQLRINARVPMK
jgi:hypothetical protein